MRSVLPSRGDTDVVRSLTREAASEPTPELDWERIERRLLADLDRTVIAIQPPVRYEAPVRAPSPPSWRDALGVALAAAAMVALAVGAPSVASSPAAAGAPVAGLPTARDLEGRNFESANALRAGDVVEAQRVPVVYQERDVATWTLAPGSRARIVSEPFVAAAPVSMTIALLAGSIHAEVVHRDVGESFAVEVGSTRIAAHGTSFDVIREGDRAIVVLAHGSVAIGPMGHPGSTQGWLLVGPERASFSLDGGRDVRWMDPLPVEQAPVATLVPHPPSGHEPAFTLRSLGAKKGGSLPLASSLLPVTPGASEAAVPAEPSLAKAPASEPPGEGAQAAVSSILTGLDGCYERQLAEAGVEFTIESSLRLTILPDGRARDGVFVPPLSPALMSCAARAIGEARFPRSAKTYPLAVPVRLSPPRPPSGQR